MSTIDVRTLSLARKGNTTSTDGGSNSVETWEPSKKYSNLQLIAYMGKLYRVIKPISNSTSSPDIDLVNYEVFSGSNSSSGGIKFPDFTPNKDYSYGDCIVHNFCLLSAKASFTSGQDFNKDDWNVISDMHRNVFDTNYNGIVDKAEYALVAEKSLETDLVQSWKPNTRYTVGQNLVYNYETYTVISNFTSGATFDGTNLLLSATGSHNNLRNLQGGDDAANEFYHLKKDKHDIIEKFTSAGNKVAYNTIPLGDMFKSDFDKNNDGIVDKATTLDGLTATVTELNYMHGVTSDVQAQINALSSVGNFTGSVPTHADIATTFTSPKQKDMVIVVSDETHGNTSTIYLYNGTSFAYSGAFTATVRDFSTSPLDINLESTGILNESKIDPLIARKSDIPNIPNLSLLTSYTHTDADIDTAVSNSHVHANKALIDTYTQTNVDIGDAVNKKHTHANKDVLDLFSKDASGNPLFNGNPIAGSGGSGISDLTMFNTGDLADSTNRRYVTDAEKSNVQNLSAIVAAQTNMNNTLTNISSSIPSDASGSNKLVSTSALNTKLSSVKFSSLADVDHTVKPNSFVVTNSTGTQVTYLTSIKSLIKVQKITDKNAVDFLDIPAIKFNDLIGVQDASGNLTLSLKDLYTTNLLDMPTNFVNDSLLVSNANTMKYELRKISEITNSKENKTFTIAQTDWALDPTLNKYTAVIDHELNSKNLIVGFYNSNNMNVDNILWGLLDGTDPNKIIVESNTNESIRVVINCSQGAVGSGTGTGSGGSYTVSAVDFLDDSRVRTDKAYSSSKMMTVLNGYAAKSSVYTMDQANAIFSSKLNEHIHTNMTTLDGITSDGSDNLYYKGIKILTGNLQPYTYQNNWQNKVFSADTLIVDTNSIFTSKSYSAIMSTEFTVQNNIASVNETEDAKKANQVHLVVIDNTLVVLDVLIPPGSTQKYLLGISPNLKVMINGSFSANYYLTAY